MGMDFQQVVKDLEASEKFKRWKEEHAASFLAHVFMMFDEPNKNSFQIGYYNKDKDRITSFIVEDGKVEELPASEVLKDSGHELEMLEIRKVQVSGEEALEIAGELHAEEYSTHPVMKKFFILQTLEGRPVFNLTFFTQDLKTINFKIDAESGEMLKHSLKELIHFDKG